MRRDVEEAVACGAVVAQGLGAVHVRRRLCPPRPAAFARLVEIIVAISSVVLTSQLMGAAHLLRPVPVFVAQIVSGLLMTVVARRRPASPQWASPRERLTYDPETRWERGAGLIGIGVVALQWSSHVADAIGRGMTHPDTLIYHQPFAARFVQMGTFGRLDALGADTPSYYPMSSQLLHSLAMMPSRSDELGLLLNVGWLVVAFIAAWCIGSAIGRPWLSVGCGAIVLSLPCLVGTQPAQASNDIAVVALMAAAVAVLSTSDRQRGLAAVAGLALGLAVGTKLTMLAPAGALILAVTTSAVFRRELRTAVSFVSAAALAGSFWFLRNWVLTGSPVPWYRLNLGIIDIPAKLVDFDPDPLSSSIFDGSAWDTFYLPGLRQAFGVLWPLVSAMVVVTVVGLVWRGPALARLVALTVVAGLAGHLFNPYSGGLPFAFNLRYLGPVLFLALVALPAVVTPRTTTLRAVLAALVVVTVVATVLSANHERVDAWPTQALLPTVLILVGGATIAFHLWRMIRTGSIRWAAVASAAVAVVVVSALRIAQDHYLDNRNVDAGLHSETSDNGFDALARSFRGISDSRVAVVGTTEVYPMFGHDLSNEVVLVGDEDNPSGCRAWRRTLSDAFDYVVIASGGLWVYPKPEPWVIADDPATTLVMRSGDTQVYRLRGPLHPSRCG